MQQRIKAQWSALAIGLIAACSDPDSLDPPATGSMIDAGVLALRGPGTNTFAARGGDGGAPLQVRAGVITAMHVRTGDQIHQITFRGYYPVHGDNIHRGEPLIEFGPFGGSGGVDGGWQQCLSGWAAVGLQGNASGALERVGLVCSNLQDPKQVQTLPAIGGTGGAYFHDQCGQDELMTGADLRYGSVVDSLKIYCQKK